MIITKVVIYSSVFIKLSLSLASNKSTLETPWNYEIDGQYLTSDNELVGQLLELQPSHRIVRQWRDDITRDIYGIRHKDQKVPDSFDARQNWPQCGSLSRVKNQLTCNVASAFVAAAVIKDRFCIAGKGSFDVSEQDIITCCKTCPYSPSSQCDFFPYISGPVSYIMNFGVVDTECKPYNVTTIEDGCKQGCKDAMAYGRTNLSFSFFAGYVAKEIESTDLNTTLKDIQIEIMKYGPVASTLKDTPNDFRNEYTNQVYIHTRSELKNVSKDEKMRPHDVKIIGWGIENEVPYWLCTNSWGETWGQLKGFFKIKRGSNELGIEELFSTIDTDPESRPKLSDNDTLIDDNDQTTKKIMPNSSPTSFTKILHFYKITIIVAVIALFV